MAALPKPSSNAKNAGWADHGSLGLYRPIINTDNISVSLQFPDGEIWVASDPRLYSDSIYKLFGYVVFPKLPDDVESAVLLVTVASDAVEMAWPLPEEGISATLTLLPASNNAIVARYPEPQALNGASVSRHGITMTIKKAVYGEEQIALDVEFQNASSWYLLGGGVDSLRDNSLKSYMSLSTDLPFPARRPYFDPLHKVNMTFTFSPALRPEAKSLTLVVDTISVYTDGAPLPFTFTLDLGPKPQVDQTWLLDIAFEVAGIPYHIVEAHLKDEMAWWRPNDEETQYFLEIAYEEPFVRGDLQSGPLLLLKTTHEAFTSWSYSARLRPDGRRVKVLTLGFSALPTGEVTVIVSEMHFRLRGPWRVTWAVPPQE